MTDPRAGSLHEPDDPQLDYRTVEPVALLGLGLGLASPVALLGGLLTLIAALGVLVNLVALARLKGDAVRIGRGIALIGLALSVIFTVAPMARWASAYLLLANQPRPMADAWFEFLRQDKPEQAYRLRFHPDLRPPSDDSLWLFYRNDEEAKEELRNFVADPLVRRLLALGQQAQVRFYKTEAVVTDGADAGIQYTYTVTFPDDDGKKTFFASVLMERRPVKDREKNPWRVKGCFGGRVFRHVTRSGSRS